MSGTNKNDWDDFYWKKYIANEKLRLDIVFNKVEKTIEQENKETRACI